MTQLKWEKLNMRRKIRTNGSLDGRFAVEMKRIERTYEKSKKKPLSDKDRRSLHYIMTGERI